MLQKIQTSWKPYVSSYVSINSVLFSTAAKRRFNGAHMHCFGRWSNLYDFLLSLSLLSLLFLKTGIYSRTIPPSCSLGQRKMNRSAKYMYIIGGCALAAEREPVQLIERIRVENVDISSDRIKIISENCGQLSIARRSPSCFLLEKNGEDSLKILVAGGCTAPNKHTNTMEVLNISNISTAENVQKLEVKSDLLEKTLGIGASCSGFDVETKTPQKPIFGGFEAHSCLDDVQVVDTDTASWQCRKLPKNLLPKIKNSTIIEVANGDFLMFGGWEDESRTTKAIRRICFNEDFSDYTVDFVGFLPYPVEGHSCVLIGSSVFLIGGFDGCFVIDTIIKYDLLTRKSEVLKNTKLHIKRENHVSCVLGGKYVVVAGGWNSRESLDNVEVFEIRKRSENGEIELVQCQVDGKMCTARNRPSAFCY